MRNIIGITFLALLVAISATLAESLPSKDSKEIENTEYIPADLKDAVRVLRKKMSLADQEAIRKHEIGSDGMHFGLGMTIRNRWGLRSRSRLANYFNERGVFGEDSISNYILEALCRDIRGQDFDLLQMMREESKKSPCYHAGDGSRDYSQAILYWRLDYDEKKRILRTALFWDLVQNEVYFYDTDRERREATPEYLAKLKQDEEHWLYSESEQKFLRELRQLDEDERLAKIQGLDENLRRKFDGFLPRTRDPNGIDKETDPFAIPHQIPK